MKQRYPNMRRFRDANYRRPLILIELLRYNADVICLQEVDEKAFTQYFEPHLKYAGGPPDAQPLLYVNYIGMLATGLCQVVWALSHTM